MRSGAAGRAGARAAAKLGDRAGAEDAMARGRRVLDRLAEPVHPDHHFVVDPAKADFYAVDVYRWLGADDAAESFAREVLEHSVGPDGHHPGADSPQCGTADPGHGRRQRGELDVAVGFGLPALGDPRQCKPSLLLVAADLDAELTTHRAEPVVTPWHETLAEVHRPRVLES